jgi:hypothetical protein
MTRSLRVLGKGRTEPSLFKNMHRCLHLCINAYINVVLGEDWTVPSLKEWICIDVHINTHRHGCTCPCELVYIYMHTCTSIRIRTILCTYTYFVHACMHIGHIYIPHR